MVKQTIVVRRDLNMSPGKLASQVAHAACFALLKDPDSDVMRRWSTTGLTKVVLAVDSEQELLALMSEALVRDLSFYPVFDEGRTEFNRVVTLTCCSFGPDDADRVNLVTGHLPLY